MPHFQRGFILIILLVLVACGSQDSLPTPDEAVQQDNTSPTTESTSTSGPTALPPIISERLEGPAPLEVELQSVPYQDVAGRPRLSGPVIAFESTHFRMHFTLSGDDAVNGSDDNGDGVPNYVAMLAAALEYAWETQIEHFGWPLPPNDAGAGGSDAIDVYIQDLSIEDLFAYVEYEEDGPTDNPNTASIETSAHHSFIVFNLLEYFESNSEGFTAQESVQSTAVHEFMHVIQFGLFENEDYGLRWLFEASASWIEDEVLNEVNGGTFYSDALFKSPDTCLIDPGDTVHLDDYNHWYSEWHLLRLLSESYGHSAVIDLWQTSVEQAPFQAWESILQARGTSFEQLFEDYSIALLTRNFEEGFSYPLLRLEGSISAGQSHTPKDGVGSLGADYFQLEGSGPLEISLTNSALSGIVIGINGDLADHYPLQSGITTVDANRYENLYLVVINFDPNTNPECQLQPYQVQLSAGANPQDASGNSSARNFAAPLVELRLSDLALGNLPAGFAYESAYQMDREEYVEPDYIDVIVPGQVPVYVIDYSTADSLYWSVYGSESPYADMDAFFAAQTIYSQNEMQILEIEGHTVLLVDYSSDSGEFTTFTFILDGVFIVVEGNTGIAQGRQSVASFLRGEGQVDTAPVAPAAFDLPYLPEGFSFSEFYEVSADEFWAPDLVEYYIPGGGLASGADFFNPNEDNLLFVLNSPSPYATLPLYLIAAAYPAEGNDIRCHSGIEALYEDLSEDGSPYYSVTMIHAGQFAVLEGPFTDVEMEKVAGGYATLLAPNGTCSGEAVPNPSIQSYELPYVPAGYEYIETYEVTRATFWAPEFVDYYIPDDVIAETIDYYGPGEDDVLYILWSASPYTHIDDYLAVVDYTVDQSQFRTIAGVLTLFEDLSDDQGPYWNVIIILNGQFVVIEGPITEAEMTRIVESWLQSE